MNAKAIYQYAHQTHRAYLTGRMSDRRYRQLQNAFYLDGQATVWHRAFDSLNTSPDACDYQLTDLAFKTFKGYNGYHLSNGAVKREFHPFWMTKDAEIEDYNDGETYTITRYNEDGTIHHQNAYRHITEASEQRLIALVSKAGWTMERRSTWKMNRFYQHVKRPITWHTYSVRTDKQ